MYPVKAMKHKLAFTHSFTTHLDTVQALPSLVQSALSEELRQFSSSCTAASLSRGESTPLAMSRAGSHSHILSRGANRQCTSSGAFGCWMCFFRGAYQQTHNTINQSEKSKKKSKGSLLLTHPHTLSTIKTFSEN